MNICSAFENAKIVVKITHGKDEAEIFQLLVPEDLESNPHFCDVFGPFPKGKFKETNTNKSMFNKIPPIVPQLIGRQKDMFKIISKVLSPIQSRMITLMGLPGIGKSAIVRNMLHHIHERGLLQGGTIEVDCRGV
jgi:Cdc6-like AAA superfamily ATPase